jgi:hypothetical protein
VPACGHNCSASTFTVPPLYFTIPSTPVPQAVRGLPHHRCTADDGSGGTAAVRSSRSCCDHGALWCGVVCCTVRRCAMLRCAVLGVLLSLLVSCRFHPPAPAWACRNTLTRQAQHCLIHSSKLCRCRRRASRFTSRRNLSTRSFCTSLSLWSPPCPATWQTTSTPRWWRVSSCCAAGRVSGVQPGGSPWWQLCAAVCWAAAACHFLACCARTGAYPAATLASADHTVSRANAFVQAPSRADRMPLTTSPGPSSSGKGWQYS